MEAYGVIRNVPLDFLEDEIFTNIVSEIKVKSVSRTTRRDPQNNGNFLPTFSIKIGFEGKSIPDSIQVFCVNFKVNSFPRAKQCFKCGRLGHRKFSCRPKTGV